MFCLERPRELLLKEVRMTTTTWKPHTVRGQLDTEERNDLPDSVFAFPKQRKEPLTDAEHVRNALARFDQVEGVSDADRDRAFANIKAAADYYDVEVAARTWQDLGKPADK
jgi:hypothetical protein